MIVHERSVGELVLVSGMEGGTVVATLVDITDGVFVTIGEGSGVWVGVDVGNDVAVAEGVTVGILVGSAVGVLVGVGVGGSEDTSWMR